MPWRGRMGSMPVRKECELFTRCEVLKGRASPLPPGRCFELWFTVKGLEFLQPPCCFRIQSFTRGLWRVSEHCLRLEFVATRHNFFQKTEKMMAMLTAGICYVTKGAVSSSLWDQPLRLCPSPTCRASLLPGSCKQRAHF